MTATALTGTILDGQLVFDAPVGLPNGTRGRFVPDPPDGDNDFDPSPDTHDRATELAILRESLEDAKAGRTRPFEEVMAEIAAKYNLPDVGEE